MRRTLTIVAAVVLLQIAVAAGLVAAYVIADGEDVEAQAIRDYDLEITRADIDYGGGNVWHAWTFNGKVPGPVLTVTVGERLRVHVKNNLDLVHSFHTHLAGYDQESDGSQTNIITGTGSGAMIPPGGEFTYEFEPTEPGIFYYHCHSADGGLHISQHIHQGLYGAIVVKAKDEPPVREEVIFMAEIGHETEGENVPRYIMNGLGLPGGEHTLEQAYVDGGFDAVAAQLNVTVPAITAKVGEEMRVHLINIGDQIHSFHAHNVNHVSENALQGRIWPANVVPLIPGAADTLRLTFTKPGIWLFHCHVVNHADAGMIGVFIIEGDGFVAPTPEQPGQAGGPGTQPGAAATPAPDGGTPGDGASALHVEVSEWAIAGENSGALPEVAAGEVAFELHNEGAVPHELAIIKTDTDPAELPLAGGAVDEETAGELIGRVAETMGADDKSETFALTAGTYALICNLPGHYQQGMRAQLIVR